MANNTEQIIFGASGLNTDDAKRFLPSGDTDFRLNLIPSSDGKHGKLTSIKGNRLITALSTTASSANLITDWINANAPDAYEEFTTSGSSITFAVNTSDNGIAFTNTAIPLVGGTTYYLTVNLTLNSGEAPTLEVDGIGSLNQLSAGLSTFTLSPVNNIADAYLGLSNSSACNYAATFSLVSYTDQPTTIVGDCYDSQRNCQYIAACGSSGYHFIFKYSYSTGALTYIVNSNPYLGFDTDYLLFDMCVIGDWLFWNPRNSSPRALNVVWAENYQLYDQAINDATTYDPDDVVVVFGKVVTIGISQVAGTYLYDDVIAGEYMTCTWSGEYAYHTMDQYFYNYMCQPKYAPSCELGSDTNRNVNNIRKNVFQFCYRYIGQDGKISVTSPYSPAVIASSSENYFGEIVSTLSGSSIYVDNQITVSVRFPDDDYLSFANLAYIEVLFRTSEYSGWSNWKVADKIMWEDIVTEVESSYNAQTVSYVFYNDKSYPVVDQSEVSRSYSALPSLAKAQESLMNNRIAYGGLTEGIDNVTPVGTLTATYNELALTSSGTLRTGYGAAGSATITETYSSPYYYYITAEITGQLATNVVAITISGVTNYYVVTVADAASASVFTSRLVDFVNDNYFTVQASLYTATRLLIKAVTKKTVTIAEYTAGATAFYKRTGFKTGATHRLCQFYYDSLMRRSGAMYSDNLKVYVPFITESNVSGAKKIANYYIDWEINHAPPEDAVYWRWGYAGNTTMTYFFQTEAVYDSVDDSKTSFDITIWQETLKASYPHINIEPYEFQQGDRVRFIAEGADTTPFNIYYDDEIIDFDTTTNKIYIRSFISPTTADDADKVLIEVYRPQKTEDVIFHEIGSLYDIYTDTDGQKYHRGQTQDQTHSVGATGSLVDGDIHHITRYTYGDTSMTAFESMSASDYYDSSVWSQGKIGIQDYIGKVEVNNIRWSDSYVQGTKINGLSSFQGLNYDTVTNKYGDIMGMVEVGHTLRVYCESNGISIPVGRTSFTDATGNDTVVVSDKILGAQRIDEDGYGTVYPESICKVGTRVYFFDTRKSCFIRDSLNGAYPISGKFSYEGGSADFKMETFFKEKADAIKLRGESNFKIKTGYDSEKKLVVVMIDDVHDGGHNDIICFHEPSNRWVTFLIKKEPDISYTEMPEWISKDSPSMFMYMDGGTWIHDNVADICKFFGIQRGIENRVYSHEGNNLIKLYEAISIHCNQQLDLDEIYVYNEETGQAYQLSLIPDAWWEKIEGVYRSAYLRDMLTNGVSARKDLFNGDFLRGYVIENRLTKDSVTTELNLFKVDISTDRSNV
jgi:hypothetical protein